LPPFLLGKQIQVAATEEISTDRAPLPPPAGPVSELVLDLLSSKPPATGLFAPEEGEPLGDDVQLALYLCYELHYRSFDGVDPDWEWDPALLALRGTLERAFFAALEEAVSPQPVDPDDVGDLLFEIEANDDGPSLSRHLQHEGTLVRFREFVAHRSLYQLKEADPHSWAIPRLSGAAKSALLEVQGDEYGAGRPERMHSALFAKTMRALGLDDRENAYLRCAPGTTLATVNLMSALGLRASRRGALVGHLAMFEMTSSRPNRRYADGLRRLGFDPEATDFYDEHVEADAVHENIAAYDLAGQMARSEPRLAADVVFGARAMLHLEARFAAHLLEAWSAGASSLREPL
jgi:hypothetical protein